MGNSQKAEKCTCRRRWKSSCLATITHTMHSVCVCQFTNCRLEVARSGSGSQYVHCWTVSTVQCTFLSVLEKSGWLVAVLWKEGSGSGCLLGQMGAALLACGRPCSHTDIDPPMYVHSSQLHCTAPTVRSTYVHSSAVQCSHSDMDPPMQQDTVLPPMATLLPH